MNAPTTNQPISPEAVPDRRKILTVGELNRQIKALVEDGFRTVWVSGEVSNLSRPGSGHLYLCLKDAEGQLRAVMWRSAALRLRFDVKEGMEVIARGRLTVYVPRGDYQLQIEELQPKGLGALELALRQLKEKLLKLGYFASERKKPLPRFPRRVALVTSASGAAVRDILEILGRRWPAVEAWVCPVRVQGEGAAEEIAAAIRLLNRVAAVDVMIVGRGGGSVEDLWAFNAECIAQAIFESRIPVVSAVGHEIDLTIADLVADCRALTPSEAAERVVPDRAELVQGLCHIQERMRSLLLQRLDGYKNRLDGLAQRRALRLPLERLRELERRLDEGGERLHRGAHQRLEQVRERLQAQAARLETLSPLNVLGRGYSLTRREADRAVIRSPDQLRPGERLVTDVADGRIISRVEELERTGEPPASEAAR
ncbi:MAG TPA: exodeoxyribonuclease VII large subunit [Gemmataceae bacterium]|nr:exodeoxyribonuclease VII large subunit [Gemmataceae bacterium]